MLTALRLGIAVLGVVLLVAAPRLNADQQTAPTENGWWIRINTAATKASEIAWQFGTTPDALIAKVSWQPGMGSDIVLADPLRLEGFMGG